MYSLSVLVQEIRGMKDKLGEKLEVIKSKEGTVTSTVHKTSKRNRKADEGSQFMWHPSFEPCCRGTRLHRHGWVLVTMTQKRILTFILFGFM